MRTAPRTPLHAAIVGPSQRAEEFLSSEALAAAAGVSPTTLARLVGLGLVEPTALRRGRRPDSDGCYACTAISA